jgi:hypothetical protein
MYSPDIFISWGSPKPKKHDILVTATLGRPKKEEARIDRTTWGTRKVMQCTKRRRKYVHHPKKEKKNG